VILKELQRRFFVGVDSKGVSWFFRLWHSSGRAGDGLLPSRRSELCRLRIVNLRGHVTIQLSKSQGKSKASGMSDLGDGGSLSARRNAIIRVLSRDAPMGALAVTFEPERKVERLTPDRPPLLFMLESQPRLRLARL
jgi:hypothetical protein